jgi:hypothetical protein
MKMIEEKMEQREKKERKSNVIKIGIRGIRGRMVRKGTQRKHLKQIKIR